MCYIYVYICGHNYSVFQKDVSTCKLYRRPDDIVNIKNNGNSFLKKIIKQEVLNRWFFVETKAILGRERRTVSDCGSHMHRLFQKHFRKQCTVNASHTWLKGKDVYLVIKGHRSSGRWKNETSKWIVMPTAHGGCCYYQGSRFGKGLSNICHVSRLAHDTLDVPSTGAPALQTCNW